MGNSDIIRGVMMIKTLSVLIMLLLGDNSIQSLVDEACLLSGGPGISVGIIKDNYPFYYNCGYSDVDEQIMASPDTLYELASVSKSFTASGILKLEEQGMLNMTDSIQEYLPNLNMSSLTLNHFLYHTSGITNEDHMYLIKEQDTLKKTVDNLNSIDLAFLVGERFQYGTLNYDVLGRVIEVVSGQSFESYMENEVFKPLGLTHTTLNNDKLAQGYKSSFLIMSPYDAPTYDGNKPAGYVISNVKDMVKWMRIQIDTPHIADRTVDPVDGFYYGDGWSISEDNSMIEHSGVNPTFSSQVVLYPKEKIGITVLSNSAHVNNMNLALGIKDILDGNPKPSYERSLLQLSDWLFTAVTVLSILLIIFHKRFSKIFEKHFYFLLIVTLILIGGSIYFPRFIGHTWTSLLVWQPLSLVIALISLTILSTVLTVHAYPKNEEEQ